MHGKPLKLLLIEDSEEDSFLVRDMLAEISSTRYRIDWVDNYEEGLAALLANQYDACLLDYMLGERNGLELIREALSKECDTTIVVLTGMSDHSVDMEAMTSGAADYLDKNSLNKEILERSIRYSIERKRTEKALRDAGKLFRRMADSLPVLISYLDTNLRYQFVNRAYESRYGIPSANIRGLKFDEVFGKGYHDVIQPYLEEVLMGRQTEFEI